MHHEAEHRAVTAGHPEVGRDFFVLPDGRHRGVLQAAVGPLLDPKLMRLDAIPEKLGVHGFRGPHHGVGVQVLGHRAGRDLRFAGLEFEYPPVHFGDVFVSDPPDDVLVDEPALAETGLLGSHHVAHLRGDADVFAWLQIAVIGLLAVRGDHADVAVVVHQLHDRAHGIVGRAFATQAEHRPHLNHGRWCDNSGVTDRAGRVLIPVDGVGVTDGFDPAVDHRLVHWVPG